MGYTNKTSHYELPQYVANDKPSWLGDFNAAMLKIDTAMADNDATAEAANSAATGAQTQVSALSAQLSTIQGQVNTAVDTATTADGKATTAQTVAGEANTNASEAKTLAGEAKTLAQTAKQTADNALPIGGGTMTGPLVLAGAPTSDNQAATKGYVDSHASGVVSTSMRKHANANFVSTVNMTNQGKIVSVSTVEATYVSVTSVGVNSFIPFARSNSAANPLGLTVNAITGIGTCHLSRSGNSSFVTLYALYDGTYTYVGTPNAQVGDKVTPIGAGFVEE